MKKYIPFCIVIVCLIPFLAWCHHVDKYSLSQAEENIDSIEIVYVDEYSIISRGDYQEIASVTVIPEDRWGAFWDAFHEISSKKGTGPEGAYIEGYAIRITYAGGGFELIGERAGYYSANGVRGNYREYYFDRNGFYQFIQDQTEPNHASK